MGDLVVFHILGISDASIIFNNIASEDTFFYASSLSFLKFAHDENHTM